MTKLIIDCLVPSSTLRTTFCKYENRRLVISSWPLAALRATFHLVRALVP